MTRPFLLMSLTGAMLATGCATTSPQESKIRALLWDAATEFAGPQKRPAVPLTPWEKYAQVLLQSNEFVFVD